MIVVTDFLKLVPKFLIKIFDLGQPLLRLKHPEHFAEIAGIQTQIEGLDMATLLFLNYLYDFKSLCTSIVTRTPDGKTIHGRNLDYAFPDMMRKILYVGQFYRGDEFLFEAVMMAGHIGVYTGVRPEAFSISFNARSTDKMSISNWIDQAELVMEGGNDLSWNIRDTLATCRTYACAYKNLMYYPTLSPGYIIMAGMGKNEGAVISRDRDGPAHIEELSDTQWYVI